MEDFCIEYYIDDGEGEKKEISVLQQADLEQWRTGIEAYALSEYYKRKIKISKTN